MRRDFTVNALAKDEDGNIIDEWRGLQALEQMTLRTPLDPIITLSDDPLRLLRALRFSITKGFRIAELFNGCYATTWLNKKIRRCSFSRKNQRRSSKR